MILFVSRRNAVVSSAEKRDNCQNLLMDNFCVINLLADFAVAPHTGSVD